MKATEQYFPVVMFIMLYKVVLTHESVGEILECDHSNESYWAVLSCGDVYYAVQGGSNSWVCGWNPRVWLFKWKLQSSTFQCAVYDVVEGSYTCDFWVCGWNPKVRPFKWKLLSIIIQQIVTMPIYGKEALNICHPTWQISCDIRKWPYLEVHCRFSFIACLADILKSEAVLAVFSVNFNSLEETFHD